MIVTICSEKGGTGKTTIATNIAVIRALNGCDVLLLDCDPQASSTEFNRARGEEGRMPEITCTAGYGAGIKSELRKLTSKFDDIIVDVGGKDTDTLRSCLLVSDIVIVPFLLSSIDIDALRKFDKLIGELRPMNEDLKCYAFANKVDTNPRILEFAELKTPSLQNIEVLEVFTTYRVAYRRAVGEGASVVEIVTKKEDKIKKEILELYKEIFKNDA